MTKTEIVVGLRSSFNIIRFTVKRIWATKKGRFHEMENDPDREDA